MTNTGRYQEAAIFLIEDDDIDAISIQRAFKDLKVANPIIRANNGEHAMEMLNRDQIPSPHIILLDINMPKLNGIEFLGEIRSSAKYSKSIVFVLTTSNADKDVIAAYNYNVAGYIVKSDVLDEFENVINVLDSYWRIIEIPT